MIKTFFRRLMRDSVDFMMLVVIINFVIVDLFFSEMGDTLTYLLLIVFFWGVRFVIWHAIVWEKVESYVTDDFVRRRIFGLGSYDPRDGGYEKGKHILVVIIDSILKVVIIGFVTFVAVQIIFFN